MLSHAQHPGQHPRRAGAARRHRSCEDEVFLSFLPLSHAYEHTAGQFLPIALRRRDLLRRGRRDALRQPRRGPADDRPLRAAALRGDAAADHARRRAGRAGSRRGCSTRPWSSAPGATRAAAGCRRIWRCSTSRSIAWCGSKVATALRRPAQGPGLRRRPAQLRGRPVLRGAGPAARSRATARPRPRRWSASTRPGRTRLHTVGPPLDGVELRIAEDGEILVRGDLRHAGLLERSGSDRRRRCSDGWLHTGDIGELDADGYLKITDRKKDMIVNSGGDNVAPQRIEGHPPARARDRPGAGLRRSAAQPRGTRGPACRLRQEVRPRAQACAGYGAARPGPSFKDAIGTAVARANKRLSAIERVRRFHVMAEPFTIENGMQTPTLKLRRHIIVKTYRELIEALYTGHSRAA